MPLHFDHSGKMIPPAPVVRTLEEPFLAGTLPTWLTTTAGAGSFSSIADSNGFFKIQTAATANSRVTMTVTTPVSTASHAFRWDLDGLYFTDSSDIKVGVFARGSNSAGFTIEQASTDETAKIIMGGTTTPLKYQMIGEGTGSCRRNLSIIAIPSTREVFVVENDQVMVAHKGASFIGGQITLGLEVTALAATAKAARLGVARFTLFQTGM